MLFAVWICQIVSNYLKFKGFDWLFSHDKIIGKSLTVRTTTGGYTHNILANVACLNAFNSKIIIIDGQFYSVCYQRPILHNFFMPRRPILAEQTSLQFQSNCPIFRASIFNAAFFVSKFSSPHKQQIKPSCRGTKEPKNEEPDAAAASLISNVECSVDMLACLCRRIKRRREEIDRKEIHERMGGGNGFKNAMSSTKSNTLVCELDFEKTRPAKRRAAARERERKVNKQ
jgi:hypothetical protein